jgi:hypothetical protein
VSVLQGSEKEKGFRYSGFGVWSLGFGVLGLGFGSRVLGLVFQVAGDGEVRVRVKACAECLQVSHSQARTLNSKP